MLRFTAFSILAAALPLAACTTAAPLSTKAPSESATFVGRLGQTTRLGGRSITPLRVVEDSRCPANANCIQAGTVRLQIQISEAGGMEVLEVGLAKPLQLGAQWLHLALVCPNRIASGRGPVTDYRFHFMISPGAQPRHADYDCT